jgi:endonuclease/exonuclease/phosphatase family metal-dependent hydrolase
LENEIRTTLLSRLGRAFMWSFRLGVVAYAVPVGLALGISLLLGEGWNLIAFYNTLAFWVWLPVVVLLPLCLILRQWPHAALLAPIALAFLLIFGIRFLPNSPQSRQDGPPYQQLTVMTYNILWRTDGDYQEAIDLINEADADIVALQELSHEAAPILETALTERYPYMALYPQDSGFEGQGLLSKYPILESDYWKPENAFGNQRAIIQLTERTEISVYNVHMTHPATEGSFFNPDPRGEGITDILNTIEEDGAYQVILLGDFNMPDLSNDYDEIREAFQDSYREAGSGLGFTFAIRFNGLPSWKQPMLRLDYVFTKGWIYTNEARVWEDAGGSDHHPVWAELDVNLDPTGSYQ